MISSQWIEITPVIICLFVSVPWGLWGLWWCKYTSQSRRVGEYRRGSWSPEGATKVWSRRGRHHRCHRGGCRHWHVVIRLLYLLLQGWRSPTWLSVSTGALGLHWLHKWTATYIRGLGGRRKCRRVERCWWYRLRTQSWWRGQRIWAWKLWRRRQRLYCWFDNSSHRGALNL